MYLKSQLDFNLNNFDVLNLNGTDSGSGYFITGSDLLTTTALSNHAAPVIFNAPGDDPLEQTPAQSALADFSDNLETLEGKVELVLDGIVTARETAETIQDGLEIFGKIEDAADTVADVMGGFKKVLKLVGKVGFLKPIAKKLDDVFDDLIDAVRKVESRAKRIDEKLEDEKQFVDDMVTELESYESGVELALSRIVSLRMTVDQADAAYNRLSDMDAGNNAALEASVLNLFGGSNMNFAGLDQFLSDVTTNLSAVNGIFGNISDVLPGAVTISNQMSAIANQLAFLQTPMNVLSDVLRPVEWALDAVEFVFNLIVSPILDPILEAVGVNALFDRIGDALLGLLPDTSAIFNIETDLNAIFDQLNFIDIENILDLPSFDTLIGPDFLNPIDNSTSGVIVMNEGEIAVTGSTNNDLISGNALANTMNGGAGDDVFTPGRGNDTVNGGTGNDMIIFDASLAEFTFSELTSGEFVITHAMPLSGAPNFGTNMTTSIEQFVFSDTVGGPLTQADLANIVNIPLGTTGTYDGTAGNDFIIGNSEANSIDGGLGNDFINGGLGNDELLGGEGDDILASGGGSDIINGGTGFDTASFAGLTGPVNVVLLPTAQQGGLTLPNPLIGNISNIERVIGSDGGDRIYGDFGTNQLDGARGDDVLRGLAGDDDLRGDEGNDFLFGDLGNDTLDGGQGDDYLTTGHGNDTLIGGEGYDTAYYGGTILPAALNAILTEINYVAEAATFAGFVDHIVYNGQTGNVDKFDSTGVLLGTDTLTDVEGIYGGDGDNIFLGSLNGEVAVGGAGDDEFRLNGALEGEDAFFGGGGDDIIYLSGIGQERGNGGAGNNTLIWDNAGEITQDYTLTLNATSGTDTLDFSASQYAITNMSGEFGTLGTDELTFELFSDVQVSMVISGIETLIGTDLADTVYFARGENQVRIDVDTFYAGAGDDLVQAHRLPGGMTLYGEDGNDTLTVNETGGAAYGGAGDDILYAIAFDDSGFTDPITLDGGDGDDLIVASGGINTLVGGAGIDTLAYTRVRGVDVHIGDTNYNSQPTETNQAHSVTGFENVIGSRTNDTIRGSVDDNVIMGRGSNDTIYGLAGDDVLFGGDGNDNLFGGDGNDLIAFGESSSTANSSDVDYADGGAGDDTLSFEYMVELRSDVPYLNPSEFNTGYDGSVTVDLEAGTSSFDVRLGTGLHTATFINIENVIGTAANDVLRGANDAIIGNRLYGGDGDDRVWGFDGNDSLVGGNGDDAVDGGLGDDVIVAGLGMDRVFGGFGEDTLVVSGADQGVNLDMTTGVATLNITIDTPVWADTGTDEARSLSYDDVFGNTQTVMLTPEEVFRTREENIQTREDLLRYVNDELVESLSLLNSGTSDELDNYTPGVFELAFPESISTNTTTFSGIENLEGGIGDDTLIGNNLSNVISGNDGADLIYGGLGADTLNGGQGDDITYGDTGSPTPSFGLAQINIGGMGQLSDGTYTGSTTDYLDVASLSGLNGEGLTFEMLYQASDINRTANDRGFYFSYAVSGSSNEILVHDREGQFRIWINGTIIDTGVSTEMLEDGGLHRLSYSYELLNFGGGNLIGRSVIYVDGIEVYNQGISTIGSAVTAGGRLVIGQEQDASGTASFNAGQILSGSVGDVRVWNYARSESEITGAAFTSIDPTRPELLDQWSFDNGTIVNLAGTNVMTLNGGAIEAQGGAGNDVIDGGAGDDMLFGEDGNDIFLSSTEDADTDDPDNLVDTHDGADVMDGGAGVDTVSYANSSVGVTINLSTGLGMGGDAEGDSYINIENVEGSYFADMLIGNDEDNIFFGSGGGDNYDGGAGNNIVDYSGLTLAISAGDQFSNIQTIIGSDLNDVISGTPDGAMILAGLGADRFLGGSGADVMDGEAGFDTMDYRNAASRVVFNVETGGTLGDAAGDSYIAIERFYGSNFNDTMTGSDANEFLYGEDGNDVINGGGGIDRIYGGLGNDVQRGQEGNDTLYGSAGADQLNGGTGTDVANYRLATEAVSLNLATGGTAGDAAGDTYFGIETVYGSDFDDALTGSSGTNDLRGFDGDDVLDGAGGNDRLYGGEGADMLIGGAGIDTAHYATAVVGVTLDLATGGTGGEALGDSFSSIEWVVGSNFDDNITGDSGANRLSGGDGADTLNGAGGNDRLLGGNGNDFINGGDGIDSIFGQDGDDIMTGGAGNDFFFGGAGADSHDGGDGIDTVSYLGSSQGIIVVMSNPSFGTNDAAGDTFQNIERLFSTNHDDTSYGAAGTSETIFGFGGDDVLWGGIGSVSDSLFGGTGDDRFLYGLTDGADVIFDFQVTSGDQISLYNGGSAYDTFAEIMAVASQVGNNVIFDFGSGNTLTLVGVDMNDLTVDEFANVFSAEPLEDPTAVANEFVGINVGEQMVEVDLLF